MMVPGLQRFVRRVMTATSDEAQARASRDVAQLAEFCRLWRREVDEGEPSGEDSSGPE